MVIRHDLPKDEPPAEEPNMGQQESEQVPKPDFAIGETLDPALVAQISRRVLGDKIKGTEQFVADGHEQTVTIKDVDGVTHTVAAEDIKSNRVDRRKKHIRRLKIAGGVIVATSAAVVAAKVHQRKRSS